MWGPDGSRLLKAPDAASIAVHAYRGTGHPADRLGLYLLHSAGSYRELGWGPSRPHIVETSRVTKVSQGAPRGLQ